jgi:signal peptidase I
MNTENIINYFQQKKDPTKEKRELLLFSAILVLMLYLSVIVNTLILSNVYVVGDSMKPTLHTGDVLYINLLEKPVYNDIIVIKVVEGKDPYIKRVIGLEGDTVRCVGIDGKHILQIKHKGENDYINLDSSYTFSETPIFPEKTVGKNEVFFLGDNRNNSEDSTELGCRSLDNVVGVVTKWSLKYKSFFTKMAKII